MSYQLELQKNPDAKPNIAMPPLPVEIPEVFENQGEIQQDMSINQGEIGQDLVENPIFPAQAAPDEANEPLQPTQQPVQETYQAGHFKRLRLEAEQVKAERDDMARRLAAYEAAQQKSRYQPEPEAEPEFNINADDLVEGKHLQQYAKKMKQLEAQLYQQQAANTANMAQAQLRAKFPDFDKVVNEDNIEQLKYAYPELANTLNSSTDLYSTAVSAYTMIKNLGIVPKEDYVAQKAQAQKNAAKPKPLASVNPQQGDSPLSKANAFANGLTPELQKQLRKEMEQARANH
jgi:hypothetical protein